MMLRSVKGQSGHVKARPDRYRESVIRASIIIGLILTTGFAANDILHDEILDASFNALSACGLAAGLVLLQWKRMVKTAGLFAVIPLLPLLLFDMLTAAANTFDIMWSLLLPFIAILLLGRRIGLVLLLAYGITAAVLLFTVSRSLSLEISGAFLVLYSVIAISIWLLETFRLRAIDRHIESEMAFRDFVNALPQIVFEFDMNGRFSYVNEPALRAFGYTEEDMARGLYAAQMFPPEEQAKVTAFIRDRMQGRMPPSHEYTAMRKDGSRFPVLIHSNPVMRDGHTVGLRGIVVDISDLKKEQAEKELLGERLHVMEKMDAVGRLAGGIAHDFNNQLAGITGFAEVIRRTAHTALPESIIEHAVRIKRIGNRVADLTSQLLAFARKGKYLSIPVDIDRLIADTIVILERSIDKRIRIERNGTALSAVAGDPSQLQNMLLNLAINARDAMPAGGTVTMTTAEVQLAGNNPLVTAFGIDAGRYLRLAVKDTGVGMSEEVQKQLFEPFFTTKGPGSGNGIGLAAAYGTVRNHKGAIEVKSVPGEGSEFVVYLPLSHEQPLAPTAEEAQPAGVSHARVLVVDDEETIRDLIYSLLSGMGYRVTCAADGSEAEAWYRDHWRDTDIVLLDMVMPGLNGRATWERLKAVNPEIRTIVISGYSIDGEAQDMIAAGLQGYLQKPFEAKDLAAEIERIIRDECATRA